MNVITPEEVLALGSVELLSALIEECEEKLRHPFSKKELEHGRIFSSSGDKEECLALKALFEAANWKVDVLDPVPKPEMSLVRASMSTPLYRLKFIIPRSILEKNIPS